MKTFPYDQLDNADLIVDAIYEGGGSIGELGDPISKLLKGVGNLGGFRPAGRGSDKKYVVLYTSGEDRDWPDTIDENMGRFTYFGDNKTPGHELHDTPKKGNLILRTVFEHLHSSPQRRDKISPFFIFKKFSTKSSSRSIQFKGLAVPGYPGFSAMEDLIAVWKTSDNQRFQNYHAIFTILNEAIIKREWLDALIDDNSSLKKAPYSWRLWQEKGRYSPLISVPTTNIRSTELQTPSSELKRSLVNTVYKYFKASPHAFEAFAARLFQMLDKQRVLIDAITRAAIDGGRDAIGRYRLGIKEDPVYVEFSLEAKCYDPGYDRNRPTSVGVKEVSRLISRLRNRQFGVLVTTSVVARQAYEEVREDRHPIIFIVGADIADILIDNVYNTKELLLTMLKTDFPL